MDLNFGGVNQLVPPQTLWPLDRSCFTDQAIAVGYMGMCLGETQQEFFLDNQLHHIYTYPPPLPYPHDMHLPVRIEIEKEQIRGEVIMSEIARLRDLMTASDLALQMGNGCCPFGQMEFCSLSQTRVENGSLKEAFVVSVDKTKRINGTFQSEEINKLPLQREVAEPELSGALCQITAPNEKALVEALQEKKHMLKEDELGVEVGKKNRSCGSPQITAAMHGAMASGMEDGEKFTAESLMGKSLRKQNLTLLHVNLNSDDLMNNHLTKIQKREWSCALCQLTVSSEQTLNDHLQGKKHRLKEVAVRAEGTGESCNIGLSPTSASDSVLVARNLGQTLEERAKFTTESLLLEKSEVATLKEQCRTPLQEKLHKSDSKINHSASSKTVESSTLCQIGASSEGHRGQLQSKKHVLSKAALIVQGAGEKRPLMTSTNSVKAVATMDPIMEGRVKCTVDSIMHGKTGESSLMIQNLTPLLENVNSDDLKKNQLTFVRKVEKSCAICRIVTPNERALNEHLQGKKHRLKAASLRDVKPISSTNAVHVVGTAGQSCSGVNFTDESFQLKKLVEASSSGVDHQPLQGDLNLDDLIDNESQLCQKVQVNGCAKTKERGYDCVPCNVGGSCKTITNSHKKGKEQLKWQVKTEQRYGCCSPDPEQVTEGIAEYGINESSEYVDGMLDVQRSEDDWPIDSFMPKDCKVGVLSKTTTNSHKKAKELLEWRVKNEGKHGCRTSRLEQITECIVENGIKPASECVDVTLVAQRSEDDCPIDSFKPENCKFGVLSKTIPNSHKMTKELLKWQVKSEGKHGYHTSHLEQITECTVENGIKPARECIDETLVIQRSVDDCPIDSFKPEDCKFGVLSKTVTNSHKMAKELLKWKVKSEGKHGCHTSHLEQITECTVENGIEPASECVDETLVVQRSVDDFPIDSFKPEDSKFGVLSKTITNSHKKAKELLKWRVKSEGKRGCNTSHPEQITECTVENGINPTPEYVDETLDVQRLKDDCPINSFKFEGCKHLHPCTKIKQMWIPKG